MNLKNEDWVVILCVLAIVSAIFAFIQGWLNIQLQYFVLLVAGLAAVGAILRQKETKTIDIDEAYALSIPKLQKLGLATPAGAKLVRGFKVSDNKRFSSYGKVWDMEFRSQTRSGVVLVDSKTGKILGIDTDSPTRESPLAAGWKEPIYGPQQPIRFKRKTEEEVKPG